MLISLSRLSSGHEKSSNRFMIRKGDNPMTKFNETDAGAAFIATAQSREFSPELMEAIAFFARDDDTQIMWGGRSLADVMAESA
jgi:hypothetical protein